MRALVLVTDAYGGHGGIAKFNRDFLQALCNQTEFEDIVAIPRHVSNPIESLPNKLTYLLDGISGKKAYLKTVITTVKKNKKFDVIICGHINLLPLAYLIRQWCKVPLALIIHGIDAWEPTKSKMVNFLVKYIDHFISVSELTMERFVAWSRVRRDLGYLLPNSFDPSLFKPGDKKRYLLDRYSLHGKTVLLTLGRLAGKERYKGFDEVIEILSDLSNVIPNITYLIVGDGDDQNRLKEKARRMGVEDRVIFAGRIPDHEKLDHYHLADAYVMPSRGEGFGIVYLEAMASGIPVIGSKLDGSREALLNGQLGILVDPNNYDEIKNAIFETLAKPKGVIPEGLDYFSFENYQNRVHRIVTDILRKQKSIRRIQS